MNSWFWKCFPGLSDNSQHLNAYKDERTQRQFFKLKKRLEARQKDGVILPQTAGDYQYFLFLFTYVFAVWDYFLLLWYD